jgi:adhesin transport system membrane fusion protein
MSFNIKKWFNSIQATQLFLLVWSAMLISFILWSYYCTIDIISMTQGVVVPSSQLKSIEHLEGGIVKKILVKEGDIVKSGDPLIELEATASEADLNESTLRLNNLKLDHIRLVHEAANKEKLLFPKEHSFNPKDIEQIKAVFRSRRKNLNSQLEEQTFSIAQKEIEQKEHMAKLNKLEERLKLVQEQVKISEELLKDELTNRYKHLDLLKEKNSLESSISDSKATLEKGLFVLKQAKEFASRIQLNYDEEVETKLKDVISTKEELEERIKKFKDHRLRRVIRAPVDGIVQRLYVFTIGGVVKSGMPVLDIVPVDDKLIIEAMLPIGDIGHVQPGMEAQVLLMSSDSRKFGHIMGKVELISPDTVNDGAQSFYKIIVTTEVDRFSKDGEEYLLVPGLTLSVNILTGHQSILEVIFSPFLERMDFALKER